MSRRWVVDASPLIVLVKAGRAGFLTALADELVIPAGVAEEVLRGGEDDPSVRWIRGGGAHFIGAEADPVPEVSGWDLGAGETAVLSWARRHRGFEVLIDDRAARNCAAALGIPARGTLGVLLLAKKAGLVDRVGPVVDEVIGAGLRVDDHLRETVLRLGSEPS